MARRDLLRSFARLGVLEHPVYLRGVAGEQGLGADGSRTGCAYLEAAKSYARSRESLTLLTDLWDEAYPDVPLPERSNFRRTYQDLVSALLKLPAGTVAGSPPTGTGTSAPV